MRRMLPAIAAAVLAACAEPRTVGLSDVIARPPERALLAGWRAYDDGHYADAERELNAALGGGLQSAKDRAIAHKLLAFVYCTSERLAECEQSFLAARKADPDFTLGRAEAGHPVWGPVYRKVLSR